MNESVIDSIRDVTYRRLDSKGVYASVSIDSVAVAGFVCLFV